MQNGLKEIVEVALELEYQHSTRSITLWVIDKETGEKTGFQIPKDAARKLIYKFNFKVHIKN